MLCLCGGCGVAEVAFSFRLLFAICLVFLRWGCSFLLTIFVEWNSQWTTRCLRKWRLRQVSRYGYLVSCAWRRFEILHRAYAKIVLHVYVNVNVINGHSAYVLSCWIWLLVKQFSSEILLRVEQGHLHTYRFVTMFGLLSWRMHLSKQTMRWQLWTGWRLLLVTPRFLCTKLAGKVKEHCLCKSCLPWIVVNIASAQLSIGVARAWHALGIASSSMLYHYIIFFQFPLIRSNFHTIYEKNTYQSLLYVYTLPHIPHSTFHVPCLHWLCGA
jgi:hypothetical protein